MRWRHAFRKPKGSREEFKLFDSADELLGEVGVIHTPSGPSFDFVEFYGDHDCGEQYEALLCLLEVI